MSKRLKRAKRLKKSLKTDPTKLKLKKEEFQNSLQNRFSELEDMQDIDKLNQEIICRTKEIAQNLGKKNTPKQEKFPTEIQYMLKERRDAKLTNNISRITYTEMCKTIRKKIREHRRKTNLELIHQTIEKNRSLKTTRKKMALGKQGLIAITDKDGKEITDKQCILERVKDFYEELYDSVTPTADIQEDAETIPSILESEVESAVKSASKGKAAGPDGIDIDIIKEGGQLIYHILTKLFNICLSKHQVPKIWKESELILIHKKGSMKDLKNYRPISLLSHIY